ERLRHAKSRIATEEGNVSGGVNKAQIISMMNCGSPDDGLHARPKPEQSTSPYRCQGIVSNISKCIFKARSLFLRITRCLMQNDLAGICANLLLVNFKHLLQK